MDLLENNPFLADVQAQAQASLNWKLQAFWPDSPVAWFGAAEAQFHLRRVFSEAVPFCPVAVEMDKDTLKKVVHLVSAPGPVAPYSALKDALLASHQLTDFQNVEMLLAMRPLGSQKPLELLADMLTCWRFALLASSRIFFLLGFFFRGCHGR